MSTRIALLRQRAIELLGGLRQLPFLPGQPAEVTPELRASAPQLFKLAYIAVGDVDSAAVLTADVIAEAPANEGAALRALVERLPEGWLSWPGAAGPSEWLALRLRREQADRVLSVLGEWDAVERLGLALYLLWGVRRDDLDLWLGTKDMAERVGEFISHIGEGLNLVEPRGNHDECAEIAADLLEMDDPCIGREIRLHTMGCQECRRRAHGLRRTAELLRKALQIFFRGSLPANFDRLIQIRQRLRRPRALAYWKPALTVVTLLVLYLSFTRQSPTSDMAQAASAPNAAQLLDHALNRFTRQPLQTGVLHERIRIGSGDTAMVLERWYDYHAPQRLRITLREPDQTEPVLDVATNGTSWLAYELNHSFSKPVSALVRNPDIAELMPLLRQLPFVSSFSETPVDQEHLDLALLAQAQQGKPMLMGTTLWQDRSAYMLSSRTPKSGRVILTIDRETLSILEARVAPDVAGATNIERVWQAEVVEVLPRQQIPANTFELGTSETVISEVDPRQFGIYPISNLDPRVAVRYTPLAIPAKLPEPTVVSHLRGLNGFNSAVLQLYEAEWSTIAIVTPRMGLRSVPWERLDRQFAGGQFTVQVLEVPQATMASFVLDDAPNKVMQLYVWHALADEAEREEMVVEVLNSIELVDQDTIGSYIHRFPAQSATTPTGSLLQSPVRSQPSSPAQAAKRRYMRSKLEQPYQSEAQAARRGRLVR